MPNFDRKTDSRSWGICEFLERFGQTLQRVTGSPPEVLLTSETELQALGIDSLSQLELLSILEEESGRRLPDFSLQSVSTLGDVYLLMSSTSEGEE